MSFVVTAFYKFISIDNYKEMQIPLKNFCIGQEIKGTVLLSHEGINGTVAGPKESIIAFKEHLWNDSRFSDLIFKDSWSNEPPFEKIRIRARHEIVTIHDDSVDPNRNRGTYVKPEDWNNLIH